MRSKCPARLWVLAVIFVTSPLYATEANGTCPVGVVPVDAGEAWKNAAIEAEKRMGVQAGTPQDCRSVLIEVQREGNALLTFTTIDDRMAVRLLHAPEDITPTLEALLVTATPSLSSSEPALAPMNAHETDATKTNIPAKTEMFVENRLAPPSENRLAPRFAPRFLFGISAGGRFGADEMLFAPTLLVRGAYALSSWELGVRAEYTPMYSRPLDGDLKGFLMYSFAANIAIGRRESFQGLTLPFGITMGLAGVHEAIDAEPHVKGDINLDTFEPLVGTYLGLVIPERKPVRFSLGLAFDVALAGLKASAARLRGLPPLPRFGLGLSMGVEVWP